MATKLERPLEREIEVDGKPYAVTLSSTGVRVVEEGHRKGQELSWQSIISGDAQLTEALRISLDATGD